ncbi:UNVERIFIED_CONTAM: hypothetical protein PYX00_000999 [Menopon gallinae]|uniref:Uncharacterized protein n=1 Tax=Menopon gallinae TaxID=328185 RepID=A0AAW2IBY3_9NEOP
MGLKLRFLLEKYRKRAHHLLAVNADREMSLPEVGALVYRAFGEEGQQIPNRSRNDRKRPHPVRTKTVAHLTHLDKSGLGIEGSKRLAADPDDHHPVHQTQRKLNRSKEYAICPGCPQVLHIVRGRLEGDPIPSLKKLGSAG